MIPSWIPGEHHALVVEPAHQHLDAAVDRPEHILFRDLAVVEHQLAVGEPRMPSLSSFWPIVKPGMSFSIRKAVMPRGAGFRSVLA